MGKATSLLLAVSAVLIQLSSSEISDEAKQLSQEWAPLFWLHPAEVFLPSSVDFFVERMQVRDADEGVVQADPTVDTVVSGDGTEELHLNTEEDLECVHCYEDFFFGQPAEVLEELPVYTHVREYGDPCSTVDVRYAVFYPYNYGKDTCVGIALDENTCLGRVVTVNNHVSDWEGVQIRFRGRRPTDLYLGAHSIGAWYVYDEMTNTFKYREGEQLLPILENIGDNLPSIHRQLLVEYPQEVSLVEGNHPEVFTANGSHGTWGAEGEWGLVQFLFVDVFDDCERGSALRAWLNPIYVDRNVDEAEFNGTDLQWVNFRGKFGNIQKLDCLTSFITDKCGLEDGVTQPGPPTGPEDAYEACESAMSTTTTTTTTTATMTATATTTTTTATATATATVTATTTTTTTTLDAGGKGGGSKGSLPFALCFGVLVVLSMLLL